MSLGRRHGMAEFRVDLMISKAIISSEKYSCTDAVMTIIRIVVLSSQRQETACRSSSAEFRVSWRGSFYNLKCLGTTSIHDQLANVAAVLYRSKTDYLTRHSYKSLAIHIEHSKRITLFTFIHLQVCSSIN